MKEILPVPAMDDPNQPTMSEGHSFVVDRTEGGEAREIAEPVVKDSRGGQIIHDPEDWDDDPDSIPMNEEKGYPWK